MIFPADTVAVSFRFTTIYLHVSPAAVEFLLSGCQAANIPTYASNSLRQDWAPTLMPGVQAEEGPVKTSPSYPGERNLAG
jgi:hypothetical protein